MSEISSKGLKRNKIKRPPVSSTFRTKIRGFGKPRNPRILVIVSGFEPLAFRFRSFELKAKT